MAAPKFVPVAPSARTAAYESPDSIPSSWMPDRPGELEGRQPRAERLGAQGPDQGYALHLANRMRDRLCLTRGEHTDDAVRGCLGIALRRASLYGRAPVVHDLTIAFTMWGFLDPSPSAELVETRSARFEGLGHHHHYVEARELADMVPESTLRMTPEQVTKAYPGAWRALTGLV